MKDKCAILVLSCDKYSDLWDPFFYLFNKYWSGCPFKIYLGSNTVSHNNRSLRVKTVLSGEGVDWSTDLLRILSQIKEEYLFIWLEDFFLADYVQTQNFYTCFEFMIDRKANHIHFSPFISPDGVFLENNIFGYYEKGVPYRVIIEGFWKKSHLEKLLIPGENPWNFEIMGSYRSSYFDGYYTYMIPLFTFLRVVEKGKISREAFSYFSQNENILCSSSRSVQTRSEFLLSKMSALIFTLVLSIPWKKRVAFMNFFRRLATSY